MEIPKETRKQLINDKKLNKYTIKTICETETLYSKRTAYFLITEEGKAFEIPLFTKLDKETMDVSNRLYKDMIIDQVFDNNRRQ